MRSLGARAYRSSGLLTPNRANAAALAKQMMLLRTRNVGQFIPSSVVYSISLAIILLTPASFINGEHAQQHILHLETIIAVYVTVKDMAFPTGQQSISIIERHTYYQVQ